MVALNLSASTTEHNILKDYLEHNASEVLADKINNGVRVIKDNKQLISRKDLKTFMDYACKQAQEKVEKGARFACIDHQEVFGWAIHYFEEDSIEGVLYNEDGTEYKPVRAIVPTVKTNSNIAASLKPKAQAVSLFDLMSPSNAISEPAEPVVVETIKPETTVKIAPTALEQIPLHSSGDIFGDESTATSNSPILTQNEETKFIDEDGVVHSSPQLETASPVQSLTTTSATENTFIEVLQKILGNNLIARFV